MATNPSTIVDAIMADLQANAGLPSGQPKSTRSYAEPILLLGDQFPMLSVWCEVTGYRILTTAAFPGGAPAAYDRNHTINVAWYVANPKQSEVGGAGDPAIVQALDLTTETLVGRLATYAGGLPGGLGPPLVATLVSRRLEPQQGFGWRSLIELEVEEPA